MWLYELQMFQRSESLVKFLSFYTRFAILHTLTRFDLILIINEKQAPQKR